MVTETAQLADAPQMPYLRVYLHDRDEGVRDSLKVLLESHDMDVKAPASRAEFLAEAADSPADCLILSSNRLIVDGLELLAALRKKRVKTPAIFIVGGGNLSTKASALRAGAAAYLERPIEEKALVRAILGAVHEQGGAFPKRQKQG
jgi:two-component system response regulator FixJ